MLNCCSRRLKLYTPTRIAAIRADKLRAQNLDVLEPEVGMKAEFIPGQNVTPEMKADSIITTRRCVFSS